MSLNKTILLSTFLLTITIILGFWSLGQYDSFIFFLTNSGLIIPFAIVIVGTFAILFQGYRKTLKNLDK